MKAHSIGGLAALVLGVLALSTASAASIYITPAASEDLPGSSVSLISTWTSPARRPSAAVSTFSVRPAQLRELYAVGLFNGLDPAFTGHGPHRGRALPRPSISAASLA